jgi:hypothetical protein
MTTGLLGASPRQHFGSSLYEGKAIIGQKRLGKGFYIFVKQFMLVLDPKYSQNLITIFRHYLKILNTKVRYNLLLYF